MSLAHRNATEPLPFVERQPDFAINKGDFATIFFP